MFFAIPDGKPLCTFPGIALAFFAIPDGKPLRTFPGIALATPPHDDMRGIAGEETHQPISLQTEQADAQFTGFAANNVRCDHRLPRVAHPR
ncbi:MAG: hypothetical protein EOQ40_20865 [Mesorhizobium sp.]|uniref:hypothetical protein n=1 Tax=Mesorhizobium sp. TaxID=1871066 RepID=UPI000FE63BCA|nr:hypothetical protein [Mesorhizobium sp.]RWB19285.1 MAG: hypothetical protein EOQ40_20865 [Mesorhizobium sp.]